MDRFWVLERSADVEGADLIIQRRLTNRSLLDRTPPRLGFIQTKFYTDSSTTQYVHCEYVRDNQGTPRTEFFVLCHTGTEDGTQAYLLTAEDISGRFELTPAEHSKPNRFALPGKDVLTQRFQILDRGSALDRIERALRDADFDKNRAFAAWALPSINNDPPPILPVYEERIDNRWGDIPKEFNRFRESAQWASWELRDVYEKLCEIQESRDPEQALAIALKIKRQWGNSVRIPDEIFDDMFLLIVEHHKRRYEQLSNEGLLGAHAAMRRSIIERMIRDVAPKMPLPYDEVYVLTTQFNPSTLGDTSHTSQFARAELLWREPLEGYLAGTTKNMPDKSGILEVAPGKICAYIAPGRYNYQYLVKAGPRGSSNWEDWGEWADTPGSWEDRIKDVVETMALNVLEQVLKDRFGE